LINFDPELRGGWRLHVTVYEGIGFEGAAPGVIFGQVYPITGLSGGHPLGEPLEPL
jgi:hypothetical protein